MNLVRGTLAALFLTKSLMLAHATTAAAADPEDAPFITEAYYRVEWGHFDEFLEQRKLHVVDLILRGLRLEAES